MAAYSANPASCLLEFVKRKNFTGAQRIPAPAKASAQ